MLQKRDAARSKRASRGRGCDGVDAGGGAGWAALSTPVPVAHSARPSTGSVSSRQPVVRPVLRSAWLTSSKKALRRMAVDSRSCDALRVDLQGPRSSRQCRQLLAGHRATVLGGCRACAACRSGQPRSGRCMVSPRWRAGCGVALAADVATAPADRERLAVLRRPSLSRSVSGYFSRPAAAGRAPTLHAASCRVPPPGLARPLAVFFLLQRRLLGAL